MGFEDIKLQKRKQKADAIAKVKAALPPARDKDVGIEATIVASAATDIIDKIKSGKWTCVQVTRAFTRQALQEDARLNFMTECLLSEALDRAAELDALFKKTGKVVGPLHGLPCSFKDQFNMVGFDSTTGISMFANKAATEDAVTVQLVKAAGGIVLFKTNVPQTMMTPECTNPLWGITGNPSNPLYTPGGSSGGEASSIMSNSSAIGFGTDIGGSLRFPMAFCGGYSLRPTEHRMPKLGVFDMFEEHEAPTIAAVCGPMAKTLGDLTFMYKFILEQEPWRLDQSVNQMPWRTLDAQKSYKFGYYSSDTYSIASPANVRAVEETVAALRAQGHTCTEIVPPGMAEATRLFVELTSVDGEKGMKKILGSDPREANVALSLTVPGLPLIVRKVLAMVVKYWYKDAQYPALFEALGAHNTEQVYKLTRERAHYKQRWLDEVWYSPDGDNATRSKAERQRTFDGLICPVFPVPAFKHTLSKDILPVAVSCFLFNLLDYSAGVVPVTTVDAKIDDHTNTQHAAKYTGSWRGVFHELMYKGFLGNEAVYNAKEMHGFNVPVQVVGQQFEEEKTLAMMKVVDDAVKAARK
ncbi:amidase signature enzyme [Protomyces lactucae-debilis]|uniref:amidase n=1 Tax=Protomyces lactucae-debilis TaxID=2754530 RepID=A0A1Y2FB42_PROLT|nr:amidase signature enzyme [Protomyces lactucae-debilis]ORY80847.1 amidase signature enzyme [Protomyces lactucae-debilis]